MNGHPTRNRPVPSDYVREVQLRSEAVVSDLQKLLDADFDSETAISALDSMHTITSITNFMSLPTLRDLGELSEQILDRMSRREIDPGEGEVEVLLLTCDLISEWIELADVDNPQQSLRERASGIAADLNDQLLDSLTSVPAPQDVASDIANDTTKTGVDWPAAASCLSPDLVRQFAIEAKEHLQIVEVELLKLETQPQDKEAIGSVFRSIHSIKGTADYVGLTQLKTLSHQVETVLDLVRGGKLCADATVMSIIFASVDALSVMVRELTEDSETDRRLDHLLSELTKTISVAGSQQDSTASKAASTTRSQSPLGVFLQAAAQHVESILTQIDKLIAGDRSKTVIQTLSRSLTTLSGTAQYMNCKEFSEPCERILDVINILLKEGDLDSKSEPSPIGSDDLLSDEQNENLRNESRQISTLFEQLKDQVDSGRVSRDLSEQTTDHQDTASAQAELLAKTKTGASPSAMASAAKSIRVDQVKLDEYINLAGELLIARNTLTHVFASFRNVNNNGNTKSLKIAIDAVDRIAGTIQENAMAMRMVPVKTVFQRFPRVVRDIARSQGKQIELQMFGEETEIDKQVAEALGDPLVHLVRNSADHGIELPEIRKAAGKSELGMITLRAGREGNSVVIDIIDDGGGIDSERLKAKAVERELITAAQAEVMSHNEALQLIFAAGLSTAAKVTDVSGRGVGMDVVRTNIRSLGGTVSVSSEAGEGSKLRIRLPLTLAVATGLIVESEGQLYALPTDVVQETVKVPLDSISQLNQHHAVSLRDQIVPIRSLGRILDKNSAGVASIRPDPLPHDAQGRVPIVVTNIGGDVFGLAVDRLMQQQELVLKPLPGFLAQIPGLGSATVMGDGSIVLILDPKSLYSQLCDGAQQFLKPKAT